MEENNKKVLVIETGLNDYERRRSIEDIFGKDIDIVPVKQVLSDEELKDLKEKYPDVVTLQVEILKKSLEALMVLINNHPDVVMLEAEILEKSVLATILSNTKILDGIQVRESLYCQSRADDKISWLVLFRGYGRPIKSVRFE